MDEYGYKTKEDFEKVWVDFCSYIPVELAKMRERKQYSQRQLANLIGVSPSTIQHLEKNGLDGATLTARILIGYCYFCDYPLEKLLRVDIPTVEPVLAKVITELTGPEGQTLIANTIEKLKEDLQWRKATEAKAQAREGQDQQDS